MQGHPKHHSRRLLSRRSLTALLIALAATVGAAQSVGPRLAERAPAWGTGEEIAAANEQLALLTAPRGTATEDLEAAGLRVARAIDTNIFLVRMEDPRNWNVVPLQVAGAQVARFLPTDRHGFFLREALRTGQAPEWALTGDGHWRLSAQTACPATDEAALRATVAKLGGVCPEPAARYPGLLLIEAPPAAIAALTSEPTIASVDLADIPLTTCNRSAQILSKVDLIQGAPYGLTGSGVRVGVWDSGRASNHNEFSGRMTNIDMMTASAHTTHVTGTIIGNGSGDSSAEGMAPAASSYNYDYSGMLFTEMDTGNMTYGFSATNNSFQVVGGWDLQGSWVQATPQSIFGTYLDSTCAPIDMLARDHPNLVIVFSAGNDRDDGPGGGSMDGTLAADGFRYDILPGFATAKNILVVGALADNGTSMVDLSNFGPCNDSRIKPDLVANGENVNSTASTSSHSVMTGTSMATPVVTGMVADLVQLYRSVNGGANPRSDLVRAILINSAIDIHLPGPDSRSGYGIANGRGSADLIAMDADPSLRHFAMGSVSTGGMTEIQFDVPRGTSEIRQTLAWIDPPGTEAAMRAIINDLDLVLVEPGTGTLHRPYNLSLASPHLAATRGINLADTVEQVRVSNPAVGMWTLRVTGTSVPSGPQNFALASSVNLDSPPGRHLIRGALQNCGVPQAGATIRLSGSKYFEVTSNVNGEFVFQVGDGTYDVTPTGTGLFFNPSVTNVVIAGNDRLDVDFAVDTSPWPSPLCSYSSGPPVVIPDDTPAGVVVPFVVPETYTVTDAHMQVFISHPRRGDLSLVLRGPGGTPSVILRNPDPSDMTADLNGDYDAVLMPVQSMDAFDGIAAAGTWELQIADEAPGMTGSAFILVLQLTCTTRWPVITTTSLPAGGSGTPYSVQLQHTGGQSPFTWSVPFGTLPAGLTLQPSGLLNGTPTMLGTSEFGVRIVDNDGECDGQALTLTIGAGGPVFSGICGDCDNSFGVNIVDALLAAQVSAGIGALVVGAEDQCNVYGGAASGISITDALWISRYVVGLTLLVCP